MEGNRYSLDMLTFRFVKINRSYFRIFHPKTMNLMKNSIKFDWRNRIESGDQAHVLRICINILYWMSMYSNVSLHLFIFWISHTQLNHTQCVFLREIVVCWETKKMTKFLFSFPHIRYNAIDDELRTLTIFNILLNYHSMSLESLELYDRIQSFFTIIQIENIK